MRGRKRKLHIYKGRVVSLYDLAEETGIPYRTLYDRVHCKGMSVEEAIGYPFYGKGVTICLEGKLYTAKGAAELMGYTRAAFYYRAKQNGTSLKDEIEAEWRLQHGCI